MSAEATVQPEPSLLQRLVIGRNPKRTLLRAALLALTAFVTFKYVLLPVRISGDSMVPAYRDQGVNFINRLAYRWRPPRRGDVVGVQLAGPHVMLFKRIVGLPGETVSIVQGVVHIDGQALAEPYVKERAAWQVPPRRLAPDEYLIIGDNRGMAQEAHVFGATKAERLVGKVLW
jgi:signal peptidase I